MVGGVYRSFDTGTFIHHEYNLHTSFVKVQVINSLCLES